MGNSSEGASPGPLVVSSIAARRLRFLHHENEESGSVKSYYNIDADSNDADGHVTFRLRAALLQGPREPAPEPAEWEADRDPSAEVWVSIDTLLKLQVCLGGGG